MSDQKVTMYLVIRADGSGRVVRTSPRLRWDEFAYRVNVTIPRRWGRVLGDMDIELPDMPVGSLEINPEPEPGQDRP